MKLRKVAKWVGVIAFLLWEAWWAYELFTAPKPDERMVSVWALLMGLWLPLLLGAFIGSLMVLRIIRRRNRSE